MMRQESVHLGGSCGGVSNKTKNVHNLNVMGQEFQRKQGRFAGLTLLHIAIFKQIRFRKGAKCSQNTGFADLYFIKLEFSALIFGLLAHKWLQKSENIFDENRKWG